MAKSKKKHVVITSKLDKDSYMKTNIGNTAMLNEVKDDAFTKSEHRSEVNSADNKSRNSTLNNIQTG